jgi:hypothetical protein
MTKFNARVQRLRILLTFRCRCFCQSCHG